MERKHRIQRKYSVFNPDRCLCACVYLEIKRKESIYPSFFLRRSLNSIHRFEKYCHLVEISKFPNFSLHIYIYFSLLRRMENGTRIIRLLTEKEDESSSLDRDDSNLCANSKRGYFE